MEAIETPFTSSQTLTSLLILQLVEIAFRITNTPPINHSNLKASVWQAPSHCHSLDPRLVHASTTSDPRQHQREIPCYRAKSSFSSSDSTNRGGDRIMIRFSRLGIVA